MQVDCSRITVEIVVGFAANYNYNSTCVVKIVALSFYIYLIFVINYNMVIIDLMYILFPKFGKILVTLKSLLNTIMDHDSSYLYR